MPKLPKGPLRGLVLMSLFITNTLAFGVPIVVISVLKILVPCCLLYTSDAADE